MSPIEQLAQQVGFHTCYTNSFGKQVFATDESRQALLSAMGFDVSSEHTIRNEIEQLKQQPWLRLLPATEIINAEDEKYHIAVSINAALTDQILSYQIITEDKQKLPGEINMKEQCPVAQHFIGEKSFLRFEIEIPKLALGYHEITAKIGDGADQILGHSYLIVAPKTCYSPSDAADYKMWGLAAQLYSLKSDNSWGIGDFGDLAKLITDSAKQGVSTIGLNPLHPLYPGNPAHRSPYSPTSRTFLNTLYIDVTKVPNYEDCKNAQALVQSKEFQEQVQQANAQHLIDYPHTAHLKYQVLELLYQDFEQHILSSDSAIAKSFEAFKKEMGEPLELLATFDALYEHFREKDFNAFGWTSWPQEYQDHNSAAVNKFQTTHASRINYFVFLQWLADSQLADVSRLAKEQGMALGLYLDLAVGCDGGGADVWSNRSLYVSGGSVGAPPDATNLLGQDWGLTPINPIELRHQGFKPFIDALRSNMRHAGAIRIDHVLGYMRQYWVAPGKKADQGIYITFPFEDLLRIIALESRRDNCVVIGEDLGTTPDGFGSIMAAAGLLSYKILFFERWESGLFQRPENYPAQSMVTVSTHDLPTLAGWWTGNDLKWRSELNLYPDEIMGNQDRQNRINDREHLIAAMLDMGTLDANQIPPSAPAKMNAELALAVQSFLAKSPCRIQMIPMEDALNMYEQVNIPGTIDEHPNWLQRLSLDLEQIWQQPSMQDLIKVMQRERPH